MAVRWVSNREGVSTKKFHRRADGGLGKCGGMEPQMNTDKHRWKMEFGV
jgi:hypothetical protein